MGWMAPAPNRRDIHFWFERGDRQFGLFRIDHPTTAIAPITKTVAVGLLKRKNLSPPDVA